MRIINSVVEMQREAELLRIDRRRISLVPTMGYLHEGHLRLIEQAKRESDVVIVSIFVNPAQFSPNEDFSRYPRDLERDKSLALKSKVDILFIPETGDMYASSFGTYVEEQEAAHILEGKIRPTHFRGVATVVAKLFNICRPHVAVFGQKDAQQTFIVKKMVRDLNFDISVIEVPIVRESDGLAMSSRNVYLSTADRPNATVLHESLMFAEKKIRDGETNISDLRSRMEQLIRAKDPTSIDYVAFIDPEMFQEIDRITKPAVLVALAVRFGTTRLIDNARITID